MNRMIRIRNLALVSVTAAALWLALPENAAAQPRRPDGLRGRTAL